MHKIIIYDGVKKTNKSSSTYAYIWMPREYIKELRGGKRKEAIDIYHHIDKERINIVKIEKRKF